MSGWKTDLVFDPSSPANGASDNIGAFVRAGSDGDLIASQTIAAEEWLNVASALFDGSGNALSSTGGALDVNIASGALNVTYDFAEDSAHTTADVGAHVLAVRQDTLASSVDADGDYASFKVNNVGSLYTHDSAVLAELQGGISIDDGGGSITVDGSVTVSATDLDIRDLSASQDNVAISDGTDTLAINADGSINITDNGGSLTVDATDLDIRSLDHTSGGANDSVRLGDGTDFITSTLEGGKQALDVYVANSIDVDDGLANTAIANAANSIGTTEESAIASALSNRKYVLMYNNSTSDTLYIGATGVTSSNGFPMPKRTGLELRAGASVDIKIISTGATTDLRTLELS